MATSNDKRNPQADVPAMARARARASARTPKALAMKKPLTTVTAASRGKNVHEDMKPQLRLIAASGRTPFEKRVWTALCSIPRGHVTTYGLLSTYLGSSPRAVGNALRRNPFAPEVPCHRVVATGMTLGGFKGQRPRNGEGITIDEKRDLLRREGVRFDDKGRVLGTPWVAWDRLD
ncbi:RING-2-like protein [Drechmeria coniospora]|uniref:Methylated-DNA--protein-cysteine methyltransferase n=1 Tax=Drechmeria coniospora TaxID=98403 RepID=A0A151GFK1_DRECN|nr:RING-2-like protein [Drechmeria coniospora]KYK55877.1 RING-2-like protein [Drechmeria coniospora]